MLSEPGVLPLVGETESQLPPEVVVALAVNGITAPPLADTVALWLAGLVPLNNV